MYDLLHALGRAVGGALELFGMRGRAAAALERAIEPTERRGLSYEPGVMPLDETRPRAVDESGWVRFDGSPMMYPTESFSPVFSDDFNRSLGDASSMHDSSSSI